MADSVSKKDLVGAVAKKVDLSQGKVSDVIDALLDEITASLKADKKVRLIGFGTFEVRERKARSGVNPQTKAKMEIPGGKSPAFKPGKELKDAVE
ncbi:MAG: HU family DNA-binding protein [Armatimonadetes bacterium]|nr:HU family DNA-binding protein [Armatimonadota bacterium]